jgi:hypothetical protein
VVTTKIVLTAEDRTRSAFEQAKRNLASVTPAGGGGLASAKELMKLSKATPPAAGQLRVRTALQQAEPAAAMHRPIGKRR